MKWAKLEAILVRLFSLLFWLALGLLALLVAGRQGMGLGAVAGSVLLVAGLYAVFGRSRLAAILRWPAYPVVLALQILS